MSRNEQEKGVLILPSAAFPAFRKTIVQAMNAQRERVHAAAAAAFDYLNQADAPATPGAPGRRTRLAEMKKALKAEDRYQALNRAHDLIYKALDAIDGTLPRNDGWNGWNAVPRNRWDNDTRNAAAHLLIPYASQGMPLTFGAPKKKNLPPLPASTTAFHDGSASLTLTQAERKVSWHVDRSNHAVDHAWASPLGQAFAKALEGVEWTRGTGGAFRYSDEYGEDAAMEHGGASVRISRHFGPRGEQEFEDEHGYNPTTRKMTRRY